MFKSGQHRVQQPSRNLVSGVEPFRNAYGDRHAPIGDLPVDRWRRQVGWKRLQPTHGKDALQGQMKAVRIEWNGGLYQHDVDQVLGTAARFVAGVATRVGVHLLRDMLLDGQGEVVAKIQGLGGKEVGRRLRLVVESNQIGVFGWPA